MNRLRAAFAGLAVICATAACAPESDLREGALVRVNGGLALPFRQTPSNAGAVYESGGNRLARDGNMVTWNTAVRTAPETCRVINTIN